MTPSPPMECPVVPGGPPALWWHLPTLRRVLPSSFLRSSPSASNPHGAALPKLKLGLCTLQQERQAVDRLAQSMEVKFLAAGAAIQQLTVLSDRLIAGSHRLAWMSDPQDERTCILKDAVTLIQEQLSFMDKCQSTNASLITRLRNYTAEVRRLRQSEQSLRRILTPLQIVGTLFRIEAASLDGEEMSFFNSLTGEINALHQKAWASFEEQFTALAQTCETLGTFLPGLEERATQQQHDLQITREQIESSLRSFNSELQESQARHRRLAEAGRKIQSATGAAIVGIQYQDITRQKWEHVSTALDTLRDRSKALPSPAARGAADLFAFLRDTCRVQVEQIHGIQEDLSRAETSISQNIHTLLDTLRTMDRECQDVCGQGEGTTGAVESMIQVLLDALHHLRTWMQSIARAAQDTTKTVASLDRAASNVASLLRGLSLDIHLIALNAQIQSARSGGLTGLSVLSGSTCTASVEIRGFSETEGAAFDALSTELHGITTASEALCTESCREDEWLVSRGRTLESQLDSCRAQAIQSIQEVRSSLHELHLEADAALKTTDFTASFEQGFSRLRELLAAAGDAASSLASHSPQSRDRQDLKDFSNNYTMESERVVHARALGLATTAVVPGLALPPQDPPAVSQAASASSAPSADDPPLAREADAPATPKPAPVPSAASDLGDNVELF